MIRFGFCLLIVLYGFAGAPARAAFSDSGCTGEAPVVQASFKDIAVRKDSAVAVVYVGAWDCSYCSKWKAETKAAWLASPEAMRISYREVESPSARDICYDPAWPPDLAWIKNAAKLRGVPRWLIVVDGQVVGNFMGLDGFDKLPARLRSILNRIDQAE